MADAHLGEYPVFREGGLHARAGDGPGHGSGHDIRGCDGHQRLAGNPHRECWLVPAQRQGLAVGGRSAIEQPRRFGGRGRGPRACPPGPGHSVAVAAGGPYASGPCRRIGPPRGSRASQGPASAGSTGLGVNQCRTRWRPALRHAGRQRDRSPGATRASEPPGIPADGEDIGWLP